MAKIYFSNHQKIAIRINRELIVKQNHLPQPLMLPYAHFITASPTRRYYKIEPSTASLCPIRFKPILALLISR